MNLLPQPEWMSKVRVGDVLRSRGGTYRVVRKVSYRNNRLHCITFAIKRCSWTKRCSTTMNCHDLRYAGYKPVLNVKWKFATTLDESIQADIMDLNRRKLNCCDVRGVA